MSTTPAARHNRIVIEAEVAADSTATTEEVVEALAALGLTVTSTRLPAFERVVATGPGHLNRPAAR